MAGKDKSHWSLILAKENWRRKEVTDIKIKIKIISTQWLKNQIATEIGQAQLNSWCHEEIGQWGRYESVQTQAQHQIFR
jgi:hypothetical protein